MKKSNILGKNLFLIILLVLIFLFLGMTIRNIVAAPLDIIVGIYHPFRDHVWNNLISGVPYKNSLLSDVVSVILPWKEVGISMFLEKIIPLWNPLVGSGLPLAANFQSGLFYPLNIIFIILAKFAPTNGFITAWNLYIFLSPQLAGFFLYLFLRQKKVGIEGSAFGAVIFSLSTQMVGWLEYGNMGHAILWLPLMLFSADKIISQETNLFILKKTNSFISQETNSFINRSSLKYLPLLSISTALSILAGYPLFSIYSIITVSLFSFFAFIFDIKSNIERVKLFLLVTIFIFLGVGLSSVQIFPSLELLNNSIRGQDIFLTNVQNYGFLPLKHFLTLFAPDLFGNPATGNYFGTPNYNDFGMYVGIISLLLAFIAPMYQREKGVRFFWFLSLLSLIFCIENPISKLIYDLRIPFLSGAFASRWLVIFDFSLAALAGYGLDVIIKNKDKPNILRNFLIVFFSISLTLLFVWILIDAPVSRRNLVLPSAFFAASSIVLFTYLKKILPEKLNKAIPLLIILLIFFELSRQGLKFNSISPIEYFFPDTKITDFLKKNAGYERVLGTFPPSLTMPYKLYSPEAYEPMFLERYSQFISLINGGKPTTGTKFGIIENYQSPLINLLGVKYIIYNPEDFRTNFYPVNSDFPKERFRKAYEYGKTQIYENKTVFPRAFLTSDVINASDNLKIANLLLSPELNLRKTVILENNTLHLNQEKNPVGETNIKIYNSNFIELSTRANYDAILFFSDNYYPGWKASVDGNETKIYRADYTFRAVYVPAGEHKVNFEYRPDSYKIGLELTLISVIVLVFSILILRKK